MKPQITFRKPVDDIEMYCELFATGRAAEILNRFHGGMFDEPVDGVVVLLHGNGEDGRLFAAQVEALCEYYPVLTVDSRGHGKSTCGNQPFSTDLFAEDLSKLCDEIRLGSFALVGFSDGGNVALTYAIRHPERPWALVLSGANLNPQGIVFPLRLRLQLQYLLSKRHGKQNDRRALRVQLLSLMVNYPHIFPRLLGNIACPALVMDGVKDVIRKKHTDLIAASIPKAQRVTVPNSHHNVFCDNAPFVNQTLLDFLRGARSDENMR